MNDLKEKTLANWDLINRLARRRFGDRPLAEEAALAVMDGLLEDDCKRLRGYAGKSFGAYLATVTYRLLEDFSRRRFGRKRIPAWIEALGGIWQKLYLLLCFERLGIVEAVETASQMFTARKYAEVEEAAWEIKQRVSDCGAHQGLEVAYEEAAPKETAQEGRAGVEERQKEELFSHLLGVLTDLDDGVVQESIDRLAILAIDLDNEEKLLLRLCYVDELSVAAAGRLLGYNRHQVHGRLRRLLGRIKRELEDAGLARELIDLLR